jgi:cleavage stimulation factor subunit 3
MEGEDIEQQYHFDPSVPGMGAPDMDYDLTLPPVEPKKEESEDSLNHPFMEDVPQNDTKAAVVEQPSDSAIQQPSDAPDMIKEESNESPVKAESPPVSEYDSLQTYLAENRYDSSAWNKLIDLAEQSGDLPKIKDAYESLLQAYPNTVRLFFLYIVCLFILSDLCGCEFRYSSFLYLKAEAQIAYLEHYLHPGLFPNAEALLNRFLRPSPSVQLWKFYLTYVR